MEIIILYLAIFIVSTIQSIAGVGILVLGTPILLLLNFGITDSMKILLPLSIISSILNLLIINIFFPLKKNLEKNFFSYFFLICFPSLFLGIYVVEHFSNVINLNILVAVIILISIYGKFKYHNIGTSNNKIKTVFISLIGFIHGLTNSGGTLLTLLLIEKKKQLNV